MRSYKTGNELSRQELEHAIPDVYAAPYLVVHRADLHDVLLQEAERLGVAIHLGADIVSIDFFQPSIKLSSGNIYTGDVIIGADGERSFCRERLYGRKEALQSSGDQVFRITVKSDDIVQHDHLADLVDPPHINFWVGPDANAVTYPLKREGLLNIVLTHAHKPGERIYYGPQKVAVLEVRKAFDGWDPRFQALLAFAQDCSKWTLFQANEPFHWIHPAGKFTLLGDSAHSMLPYL